MNSYEFSTLLIALRTTPEKIDPAMLKGRSKKEAKHPLNSAWLPDYAGTLRPAMYRALHKGKRKGPRVWRFTDVQSKTKSKARRK